MCPNPQKLSQTAMFFMVQYSMPTQVAVLKGLAAADMAKIYSSQFLESVRIASTGTVKKAVKRLEADELVYEWQRSWRFVDPFFREWVHRKI